MFPPGWRNGLLEVSSMSKQDSKVFIGGLSWETNDEKLRRYFENYGAVHEAFVSYDRNTGRPRGFGFVVFDDPCVADKVVSLQHTIDRREVEAKKAVPKLEQVSVKPLNGTLFTRTKKIFVGGLAPSVDESIFRAYFQRFGEVEDAVVMYDHDNKRPRGFGFITFVAEDSVDQVLNQGAMQTLHDKPIEIKRAVPREQMPAGTRGGARPATAYPSIGRAFASPLSKSAGLSLPGLSSTGIPSQPYSFSPLGPRLSLTPNNLSIPAVRTHNGLAEYADAPLDLAQGLSPGANLSLLLQPQLGQLDGELGNLALDDLALLQSTGMAASMGTSSSGIDMSRAAQSLPSMHPKGLDDILQRLHLGQFSSQQQSLSTAAFSNELLAALPSSFAQPGGLGGLLGEQAISAGQHW